MHSKYRYRPGVALPPGEYTLKATLAGYKPFIGTIEIRNGERVETEIELEKDDAVERARIEEEKHRKAEALAAQFRAEQERRKKQENSRMRVGKQLFQKKKYHKALAIFEEIVRDDTSVNKTVATFMVGECQFAMKQYDLAVVAYQNVIAGTPSSAIAPQARIRQAEVFEEMADNETAMLIYSKIIKEYSTSPQAITAKERLDLLGD